MGKCRNATKVGGDAQKDTSPSLSSHAGRPCDIAQDLMEEVALIEEVLSQMVTSPKMPFRFTQSSRSPSVCSLSLECQWACLTNPNSWMHSCIHVRVTLGEGMGNQPLPSYTWSGLLIANILQETCPEDQITKVVVLVLGEAVLFFGRHSCKEGLLYRNAKDVDLGLRGPVSWARRTAR